MRSDKSMLRVMLTVGRGGRENFTQAQSYGKVKHGLDLDNSFGVAPKGRGDGVVVSA